MSETKIGQKIACFFKRFFKKKNLPTLLVEKFDPPPSQKTREKIDPPSKIQVSYHSEKNLMPMYAHRLVRVGHRFRSQKDYVNPLPDEEQTLKCSISKKCYSELFYKNRGI